MTGLAQWLLTHAWAYPALETAHIAGIGLLIGNLAALEARALGLAGALPVRPMVRLSAGLALLGFTVVAASGLLMFATRPAELLANRAFVAKLLLVALAGCNAAWFHGRGSVERWDRTAKVLLACSAVIWLAAIACGRWIAYV